MRKSSLSGLPAALQPVRVHSFYFPILFSYCEKRAFILRLWVWLLSLFLSIRLPPVHSFLSLSSSSGWLMKEDRPKPKIVFLPVMLTNIHPSFLLSSLSLTLFPHFYVLLGLPIIYPPAAPQNAAGSFTHLLQGVFIVQRGGGRSQRS